MFIENTEDSSSVAEPEPFLPDSNPFCVLIGIRIRQLICGLKIKKIKKIFTKILNCFKLFYVKINMLRPQRVLKKGF